MRIKIEDDAEVYTDSNLSKHNGTKVCVTNSNEIVDADELQVIRNAIRPRIIEDVIVA